MLQQVEAPLINILDDDQVMNDMIDQEHEQPVAKARPVSREDRHPRSRAASAGYPVDTNSPRSTRRRVNAIRRKSMVEDEEEDLNPEGTMEDLVPVEQAVAEILARKEDDIDDDKLHDETCLMVKDEEHDDEWHFCIA